jgi:recombination protein RecA
MYGKGISKVGEILDIAVELGIVKKGGAWFSYNEMKLGQGRDNSKQFLLDNPEIMDEIEQKIREKFKQNEAEAAAAAAPKKKAETSKLEKLANESAGIKPVVKESEDAQEDFEEFAPVDISNLGD